MSLRRNIVILLAVLFIVTGVRFKGQATHIIGGVVSYECLSDSNYRITLKVFRDCEYGEAYFDDPAWMGLFNEYDNLVDTIRMKNPIIDTLQPSPPDSCITLPDDICVDRAIYKATVTLSPGQDYYVAYQRCCRNHTIKNIPSPDTTGATYKIDILSPGRDCNTSPTFNNYPPIAICKDEPLTYDHSASEPEGDSLVYSLCTPLHGGGDDLSSGFGYGSPRPIPPASDPYASIVWASGYSATNPLNGSPALSIDPQTGKLTVTPTNTGQYVVGVCVKEYDPKTGEFLSKTRRDFQFNVVDCKREVVAAIQSPIISCGSHQVTFENNSQNANAYKWDFGDPTTGSDQSTQTEPSYSYPDTGSYQATLVAIASEGCTDTTVTQVEIYPKIHSDFQYDKTCENEPVSFTNSSVADSSTITSYRWSFGDGATSTTVSPAHSYASPDTYNVQLITEDNNGCRDTSQKDVPFYPRPTIQNQINVDSGCAPVLVNFNHNTLANENYHYTWHFGDGTTSHQPNPEYRYKVPGRYTVDLTITSPTGCRNSDTFSNNKIKVLESPEARYTMSPHNPRYFEPEVNFQDRSELAVQWQWDFYGSDTSYQQNPTHSFPDTGYWPVELVATHQNGCKDTTWDEVFIKPAFTLYFPNAFTPNNDEYTDNFGAVGRFKGIVEYKMEIWNRWGELIYKADKVTERWNGRKHNDGPPVPQGVYVYKARVVSYFGRKYKYNGLVTVIR